MATKKSATPDYVLPENTTWSDPCSGAVGSAPNLTAIENQLQENFHAQREGRKARPIATQCPLCKNYHKEMQPPVETLLGGEKSPELKTVDVPEELIHSAAAAVVNPDNLTTDDMDDELKKLLGD